MRKPTLPEVGLYIALAALLVNSPRYVQIFLKVDGLTMGTFEPWVLGITGAATGLVLSGGQMYIAHLVAQPSTKRGGWYWTVILVWVSMLVFSVILIAPVLVAGIAHAPDLAAVLDMRGRWIWAIVAVTSVEILAAGSMVAMGIAGQSHHAPATAREVEVQVAAPTRPQVPKQANGQANGQRRVVSRRPKLLPVQASRPLPTWLQGAAQEGVRPSPASPANGQSERAGRLAAVLNFYLSNPSASQRDTAQALGVGKSTVGNYLSDLDSQGAIDRSAPGQIKVLVDPTTWTPAEG
jgi:hypothetical protein